MIKLKENQYTSIIRHLDKYTHSLPIIFSMIEGQFNPSIYVDDDQEVKWGIIFTPFDFHYVFGDAVEVDQNALEHLIKDYVIMNNRPECMIFRPNDSFDTILSDIILKFKGVKGHRASFDFNEENFDCLTKDLDVKDIRLIYRRPEFGNIENPIARIEKEGKMIAYANALMIGANQAEIDVRTLEEYRRLGYSYKCSVKLIRELIAKGLKPNWTCWEKKEASKALAKKLGFEKPTLIPTFIWVEQFGPLV